MFHGEHLELLDGLLVVGERQTSRHAAMVGYIARVLESAFGAEWHARSHAPIALDDHSEPEPDIAIVWGAPRAYVYAHPSTAALVVEVAESSLRLDRHFKGGLYARAGLSEYWIVNLIDHSLELHREPYPAPEAEFGVVYADVEVLRPPAIATPLAAPTARIAVADLLP
jgi:Uma2 family endonuclease